MPLAPLDDAIRSAMRAAGEVRTDAVAMRARSSTTVEELVAFTDRLQTRFELIKPALLYTSVEMQEAVTVIWKSRAPADVMALFGAGQLAGQTVVAAIVGGILGMEPKTRIWDEPSGRYLHRGLAGTDLTPMHAPLDELIAVLDPVDA